MTYTYILNIVAPMNTISDRQVGYNRYPIVCISKKSLDDILGNPDVQASIDSTIGYLGLELVDRATLHVRIVDNKARITDEERPLNEVIKLWR